MSRYDYAPASPRKRRIRRIRLYVWLIAPVFALAMHYQFGVSAWREDEASASFRRARGLEARAFETMAVGHWAAAEEAYSEAIDRLDGDRSASARAQLELARARCTLYKGELVKSMDDLSAQLDRAEAQGLGEGLQRDIRETLARAEFGIAWIMQYEGASAAAWRPYAEASRQHYRYLSETTPRGGRTRDARMNLEATVRLARQDLSGARSRKTGPTGAPDTPLEARNAQGQGLSAGAPEGAGPDAPQEAENAAGQGTPQEAENAAGQGTPQEAENAAGQGTPQEALNAAGQGVPAEAVNAVAQASAITEEMILRAQQAGMGQGEGISDQPTDMRDRFSRGASGGGYTGGGS